MDSKITKLIIFASNFSSWFSQCLHDVPWDSRTSDKVHLENNMNKNIHWQDWKYTSFVVFICHSQNIWCHNELSEYKFYGGYRRKHWIETPISKLILNPFTSSHINLQMNNQFKNFWTGKGYYNTSMHLLPNV